MTPKARSQYLKGVAIAEARAAELTIRRLLAVLAKQRHGARLSRAASNAALACSRLAILSGVASRRS